MTINLTSGEKKFSIVALNVTIFVAILGIIVFSINESEGAFHFYTFVATLAWTAAIPFIGKLRSERTNIPRLIFLVLLVKIGVIVAFEMLDLLYFPEERYLFPGSADMEFQYLYAWNFLHRQVTSYSVMAGHPPIEVYYPPGVALVYVFLSILNPMMNSLLYRVYILIFEAGTYYIIWKIANLRSLHISPSFREKGVIYAFFGINMLTAIDFFSKYDVILLFISLVGVYFYLENRYFTSGCLLVLAGFIKLYPFVWIFGIIVFHIKREISSAKNSTIKGGSRIAYWASIIATALRSLIHRQSKILKFIAGVISVGCMILLLSIIFEGSRLFNLLFSFQFQIAEEAYPIYMMNFWFYLVYTGLPFMNLVPYILLFVSLLYFFVRGNKEIDISFFIKTTAIVLIFYTAVNSVYINFIFPFMCIGMMGSVKKIRVLALLEIAAMWVEQLYNAIHFNAGIGVFILELDTFPPAWCVAFRFVNLGLFMAILIILVLPERFERWFPIEADARLLEKKVFVQQ